jgi:hypothetical protein
MTSRERVETALNHKQPDSIPIDFGGTAVSGMHVSIVAELRKYYGLENNPVKIHEPFQCLGLIEEDLQEVLGVDISPADGPNTFFGFEDKDWKEWRTPWGQDVLVPGKFNVTTSPEGDTLIYPEGDLEAPASGRMPASGYFFDAIIRQPPLPADDSDLNIEDNLEEFQPIEDSVISAVKAKVDKEYARDRFIITNIGGTGLGDIALVPALFMKHPKGIRDITEWYVSTALRPDYIGQIFERQIEIAIPNLKKLHDTCGDKIGAIFICGTDFGTQDSTFCSPDTYMNLYHPHYKKLNDWIHANTGWKTFKHCCGSIPGFIPLLIDSGFDIINPVQTSAKGMDPVWLKKEFGRDVTFWGGGMDTQRILSFGTPEEVREEALRKCEIFGKDGGFVFNTIHNVQAKSPVDNVVAMIDAVHDFNGRK